MHSTFYMTEMGLIQAPNDQKKDQLLDMLKRLDVDMQRVAMVVFEASKAGFILKVEYKQPNLERI